MLKKLFTKMQRQIVSFRTVLILLWGASPQAIILLILASSLTGFLTPIGLLCTQHFLDAIVRSVSAGGKFASVVIWLLLLLGVTLFGNLTSMHFKRSEQTLVMYWRFISRKRLLQNIKLYTQKRLKRKKFMTVSIWR